VSQGQAGCTEGYIYVIQDIHTSLYKIGITADWERRSRELGVGVTAKLVQIKLIKYPRDLEQRAHERYKSLRLPQSEYFKLASPPEIY
jgi:hypothetical protein